MRGPTNEISLLEQLERVGFVMMVSVNSREQQ